MLEQLLTIKKFREQSATNELRRAQHRLEQAVRLVQSKRQELRDYHQWRLAKEDELFANLQQQPVAMREIDDFKATLALLRSNEMAKEEAIRQAQKGQQEAQAGLEQARQALTKATRAREKFDQQVAQWRQQVNALREYREEIEMEEFSSGGRAARLGALGTSQVEDDDDLN